MVCYNISVQKCEKKTDVRGTEKENNHTVEIKNIIGCLMMKKMF